MMFGRRARITTVGLAGALVLAACAAASEPVPERGIVQGAEVLPGAEVDQLALPYAFQELPTHELPFDDTPRALDGVLFGLQEREGVLQFSAVSTDGHLLWTTQRPASCSGFTLTRAGDRAIAVLTDVGTSDDALAQVSASAYDLHTGEPLWGPVPVAGPWHGPGTVFAAPAPASAMGEVGDPQILDPASGEVIDVEGEIVGEYLGTILSVVHAPEGPVLEAAGANSWSVPAAAMSSLGSASEIAALPGLDAPEGYALLGADHAPAGAVVRLSDGEVLTTGATGAVWDPAAEVLVVTEPGTLAGFSTEGPLWSRDLAEGLRLSATGGVLTYLRSDTSVQVINAITGEDAVGYAPEATGYAIPQLITADGAAVFDLGGFVLVGTHPEP